MANDNDNLRDRVDADDYSLESILAEYKGSAFINGDKRTPPELLQEQAEKIILEAVGDSAPGLLFSTNAPEAIEDTQPDGYGEPPDFYVQDEPLDYGGQDEPVEFSIQDGQDVTSLYAEPEQENANKDGAVAKSEPLSDEDKERILLFFENYGSPVSQPHDSIVQDVEKAIERELGHIDEAVEPAAGDFTSQERPQPDYEELSDEQKIYIEQAYMEHEALSEPFDEAFEEVFEEPALRDAERRFSEAYSSISLRCIPAAIIAIFMVIITFAFEAEMMIPFGIERSHSSAAGTLVISLLFVMMLCVDIIVRGAENLIRGELNIETLILFSCVFSFISGVFAIINDSSDVLPYCSVSALSLVTAAYGEKYNLRAITETLKTASSSSEPYGVQAEYNGEIDKSVLKKAYNRTDGFYNNLMHPDISETVYRYATPVLLATALVLSVVSSLVRDQGQYFLHILSALLAAAAPFSAVLAYAIPFSTVVKSVRKSGAAIAGWGGADDICFTDGACVTDDDLFPPGTMSFNGVKWYDGVSPEKAIRYTASLIMASGSGLSRIFSEAMAEQGMKMIKVEDFSCHEGGVGALIRGEHVMTGSAAFMNLLGIRPPDDVNIKNAVFTAVNNKLVAMFAINYEPLKSVQSALISILRWRIKLYFAVRDFNVTPLMLEQKYRVSLEDIEYIQAKDSYNISDSNSGKEGRMSAVLTREGLGPFAEAVTGGKLLKASALVATVISVISAAVGVIFMFYICWSGAFSSAKPGNLILFMLSMLAAVLIVCIYARLRK